MDLFSAFVTEGLFHIGNVRETDCLRFCFMQVLRDNLQHVVTNWNTHRIRPTRGARCPAGVPDELFYCPISPAADCLIRNMSPVTNDLMQAVVQPSTCSDSDFGEYLCYICQQHGWQPPSSVSEACTLYRRLHAYCS